MNVRHPLSNKSFYGSLFKAKMTGVSYHSERGTLIQKILGSSGHVSHLYSDAEEEESRLFLAEEAEIKLFPFPLSLCVESTDILGIFWVVEGEPEGSSCHPLGLSILPYAPGEPRLSHQVWNARGHRGTHLRSWSSLLLAWIIPAVSETHRRNELTSTSWGRSSPTPLGITYAAYCQFIFLFL